MTADDSAADSGRGEAERDRIAVADFLLRLRRQGITDHRILSAFESVPRRLFVPHGARDSAYLERPLPIDCGQTISAPELVALMTVALEVEPTHLVMEVGTGSGYQAAILSRLAKHVYTIDRYRTLVEAAELRLKTLKIDTITTMVGDGTLGWPANATFDRIIVTAATATVPRALFDQLRPNGILLAPVGPVDGVQSLTRYRLGDKGLSESVLAKVRFVPLVPGKAERL